VHTYYTRIFTPEYLNRTILQYLQFLPALAAQPGRTALGKQAAAENPRTFALPLLTFFLRRGCRRDRHNLARHQNAKPSACFPRKFGRGATASASCLTRRIMPPRLANRFGGRAGFLGIHSGGAGNRCDETDIACVVFKSQSSQELAQATRGPVQYAVLAGCGQSGFACRARRECRTSEYAPEGSSAPCPIEQRLPSDRRRPSWL
jgi:hypothetical protein